MSKRTVKPFENALKRFSETGIERNTQDSLSWFRKFVTKNLHKINHLNAQYTGDYTLTPKPGFLYTYIYDPKTKDTLPYYDRHPVILCLGPAKGGWLGINVHYIPPKIREIIFSILLQTLNNDKMNETTKIKTSWAKLIALSKHQFVKHATKHYLSSQLMTPMVKIEPKFWEILIFLPIARFEKQSQQFIWKDI